MLATNVVFYKDVVEIQHLNIVETLRTETVEALYIDTAEILETVIVKILPKYNDEYCGQTWCFYTLTFCG